MADYKIENKKLSIEILGTEYKVNKPKFRQTIEMQDKMAKMSTEEKLSFMQECLVSYGIPSEVIDELDSDAFIELIEVISGTKKN